MAKERLVKIAKEFNVGTGTIVEYLTKNGFEIENKPTAKVHEDMYEALLKEYSKDLAVKEKADLLKKENQPERKREAVTLKPKSGITTMPSAPPSAPKVIPEPKSVVVAKEEPKPAAPKEEKVEERIEPRSQANIGLKLKGKINLDNVGKSRPKAEATISAPPKEVKKVEKEAPVAPKVEDKKAEAPKVSKAPDVEAKAEGKPTPAVKENKVVEAKVPEKKEKPTPPIAKKEEAAAKEETPANNSAESSSDAEPQQSKEVIRATAPELRGLKIKGKINLANIEGSRGKKKKKVEEKKGQPVASSDGSTAGRRRRRRRRAGEGGENQSDTQKPSTGGEGNTESGTRTPRPKIGTRTASGGRSSGVATGRTSGGGGGSRTSGGSKGKSSTGTSRRRDEVKEVSAKEIEEKIKATMARLSGGNKRKRQKVRRGNRERIRERQEAVEAEKITDKLQLTEFVSVQEMANLLDVPVTEVITVCMNMGVIVSINQRLDAEVIEMVAAEFEREVEFTTVEEIGIDVTETEDKEEDLVPRAPIVTVMGHVDHGKTSLLDYIRKSTVVAGEAGGITQHIGAYEVTLPGGREISFLDTPGHEAFTAMRARGAKVTDIAIIIISADDSIMPQTREAISHAEAAGVPMIFAINKIDKPGANPDRIKTDLATMNYLVEEWGGKYQSQDISALKGIGIEELLEKVLLEAELLELKANPNRRAVATVLEASLEKGRGFVTKALITAGTLKIGDPMVAGGHAGKVKAMFNERNKRVKEAGPSTPVLILGLDGAPQAGEILKVAETEQEAKAVASHRSQISREQANRATKRISLEEIGRRLALDSFKELNLIVKGDVDGSIEALADSLIKQSIETVQVNVIHKAVGQIIDSDILLASASDAIIIGFQVRPSNTARQLAEREGVQIKTYSVIYEAIDEIRSAIEGMLEPTKEEKIVGNAEVRETYKISKIGTIAGCFVTDGKIFRNNHIRLVRDGIVVFPVKENAIGEISSLKRFKDDVKEVGNRMECGITIRNFNDIKVGDVIEAYEIIEVKQTLDKN